MPWLLLLCWLWPALVGAQMHPFPGPGVKASAAAGGAPVRTGTPTAFSLGTPNTGSTSTTVPADATMMVCGVTGFGAASVFSGAAGSLKLNAVNFTNVTGGDSNTGFFMGALFYLANPSTGTQTLAWDWGGTAALSNQAQLACSWYKGVNASTPVRSSSCTQQGANPHATGTLTAQTNDLIVAIPWSWCTADGTWTITGAVSTVQFTGVADNGDLGLGELSPTGNQTVSASHTGSNDGGICAVTLAP